MIRINLLYVLFMIEAIVLLMALVGYFLFKYRAATKALNRRESTEVGFDMDALLEKVKGEILELHTRIENISDSQKEDFQGIVQRRIFEMNRDFLRTLYDSLKGGKGDINEIARSITKGFREAANRNLLWFKEVIDRKDRMIKKANSLADERAKSLEGMQKIFIRQKQRLADLLSVQEVAEQLKKRLSFFQDRNKALREKLRELQESAQLGEEIEIIIRELESTNKELSLCVETLEKENERLVKKLKAYEEEFERMHEEVMNLCEISESQGSQDNIMELEAIISEKDKEIERLRKALQDLENEYMVLYKQLHS